MIAQAEKFLADLLDPEVDLLPEYAGAKKYWLYHDNYLATKFLASPRPDLASRIKAAIARFGVDRSGKIEILFGEAEKPLPFREPFLMEVTRVGEKQIWHECITDERSQSWEQYADLLFLASMAHAKSNPAESQKLFIQGIALWDGIGFRDAITNHHKNYNTYKLGLAVIAAKQIGQPLPMTTEIVDRFKKLQHPSGGFITDYLETGEPVGLANVETTCIVIMALQIAQTPS